MKKESLSKSSNAKKTKNELKSNSSIDILTLLKQRFHDYPNRHKGLDWDKIEKKLKDNSKVLKSLEEMEKTGGEPDCIGIDNKTKEYLFVDCSPETPKERRSLCYDKLALDSRKEYKPVGSAIEMAKQMGVEILDETLYFKLQEFGPFDLKTSSWLLTPEPVRKLGGALFGDHRFGRTFIYHNGAESYYNVRGFRCLVRL